MVTVLTRPNLTNNPPPSESSKTTEDGKEDARENEKIPSRITLYSASGSPRSKGQKELNYNDQAYINTSKTFPTPEESVRQSLARQNAILVINNDNSAISNSLNVAIDEKMKKRKK